MQTPTIDIPREKIERCCRQHHIRRLSVFGSILRDDFGPNSDVDLLVEWEPGHTPGWNIVAIADDFSALFGGRRVDMVNPKFLNRHLRECILESAELIYGEG